MDSTNLVEGKQRRAVYTALTFPRSAAQILVHAKQHAPKITLQDVSRIMRDFKKLELIENLNPRLHTGSLHLRKDSSHQIPISNLTLDLYCKVVRASTRKTVLQHVGRLRYEADHPLTATQIKKELRESSPMSLNHVIRALDFLFAHRLVTIVGRTDIRGMKIYGVTQLGQQFCQLLKGTPKIKLGS